MKNEGRIEKNLRSRVSLLSSILTILMLLPGCYTKTNVSSFSPFTAPTDLKELSTNTGASQECKRWKEELEARFSQINDLTVCGGVYAGNEDQLKENLQVHIDNLKRKIETASHIKATREANDYLTRYCDASNNLSIGGMTWRARDKNEPPLTNLELQLDTESSLGKSIVEIGAAFHVNLDEYYALEDQGYFYSRIDYEKNCNDTSLEVYAYAKAYLADAHDGKDFSFTHMKCVRLKMENLSRPWSANCLKLN